jgi:hypothetical protein
MKADVVDLVARSGLGSIFALTLFVAVGAAGETVVVHQAEPSKLGATPTRATQYTGEWRIGELWLERAFETSDPRFRHVTEIVLGDKARTADGTYLSWKSIWRGNQIVALGDVQTTTDPHEIGWHGQAQNAQRPELPGYTLVKLACASRCVALWRPQGGSRQTVITSVGGEGQQPHKLAALPLRIEAVTLLPAIEGGALSITLMSDAGPGEPATYLKLRWDPPPSSGGR